MWSIYWGYGCRYCEKWQPGIAADDWQQYLAAEPYYFEEIMLQGMVIGAIKVPVEERLTYIAAFVPAINSWIGLRQLLQRVEICR